MNQLAIAERLELAAQHVRHGWMRGRTWDPITEQVCAVGALLQAQLGHVAGEALCESDPDDLTNKAAAALVAAICPPDPTLRYVPDALSCLAGWNDWQPRTQDEVISAFLATAATLRAAMPSNIVPLHEGSDGLAAHLEEAIA